MCACIAHVLDMTLTCLGHVSEFSRTCSLYVSHMCWTCSGHDLDAISGKYRYRIIFSNHLASAVPAWYQVPAYDLGTKEAWYLGNMVP